MEIDYNREFFNCSCHTEGLILEDDRIGYHDNEHHEFSLAMWEYGSRGAEMGWKQRFRWCYNILWNGLPWCDQVTFSAGEAKKLADSIYKRLGNE